MADDKINLGVSHSTRKLELANEVLNQVLYAKGGSSSAFLGKAILNHYRDDDPVEAARKYMRDLRDLEQQ